MAQLIWSEQNGVPASDRGLAYGDGLFETIRVCAQQPLLLDRHVRRMQEGARRLGIPVGGDLLHAAVARALDRYAREGEWILKLILTRGSGGRGYGVPVVAAPRLILSAHPKPAVPGREGVSAALSPSQVHVSPQLAGLKTLNRLDQVMATLTHPRGVYESILTDGAGRLVEGTRTNLLLDLGSVWVTPPQAQLAVRGVMLAAVSDALDRAGERVRERPVSLAHLRSPVCQGLYLLNSVIGAVPVRNIGCFELPLTDRLATICPLETIGKSSA
ncbi:aminotransferase class IV [Marinobacter sp. X15-166B]|uniref:aminotransferase class IV n=1 Tax=Marinobacter sp. X15-166B TaxID=1897620 RepID=UPI00085C5E2B|nr:aminotransferase class IV [Marinobacter sp. X15-166B]OEY67152.1 hypothetical protein BG841_12280 [Marinobacter sp. X15-166B]